jgi:large repetitive protein
VSIKVTPQAPGTITNTASVTSNEDDPAPGNNSDSESTTVNPAADLSVTKTDAPDPAKVGQNLTYTIVVTNNGPQTASGVSATDQLPKNAGFGTVTTTKGTCTLKPQKRQVACSIGSMTSGENVTIVIVVKPTQRGSITNTVSVALTSPTDPNTANNTDTEGTVVTP